MFHFVLLPVYGDVCQIKVLNFYVVGNENSINNQVKKKKEFNSSQTKDYNPGDRLSEALRIVPPVKVEGTVTYVFKTKDRTSK